jgi:non-ribosomal peptide synthetase component F
MNIKAALRSVSGKLAMQLSDLITCFRQQVDLHPTLIAIQDDSFALTYSELERWSNNLAYEVHSRLKIKGTVAICMPRSVLLVVSILAVVKAGFSYLPLDPSSPPARLDDQLLQSDARLLLSMPESQLPPLGRAIPFNIVPFIDRTCVRDHIELPSLGREIINDILAVLFTSGSTGRPKGVLILHVSATIWAIEL